MSSVYDFTMKDPEGIGVSLGDYRGKFLLMVNTATPEKIENSIKELL